MYCKNNLNRHIYYLTGKRLDCDNTNACIHIPVKYQFLLNNQTDSNILLKDFADIYNAVVLREEEEGQINLDRHGRFHHSQSTFVQNNFDQSPALDELIVDVIKQIGMTIRPIWPEGKRAVVCLTHDVDSIDGFSYFWLRKLNWYSQWIKAKIKADHSEVKKWASTIKNWNGYRKSNIDPMFSFGKIQELEDKYDFRSTFFFMSLQHGLSNEGRRYSVYNPKVAKAGKELIDGGWEVGLHAAYHHHLSLSSLKEQKKRLEDVTQYDVQGCRHHYLRISFPESWKLYDQAGFKYSSNMGWGSGFQGFRAGTCFPYFPLEDSHLLEIPFQLMDMNPILDTQSYINLFNRYLKAVKAVNGCLVLNFHQEYFQEESAPGVGNVYRSILRAISKDPEIAVITPIQIYQSAKSF